MDRSDKPMNTLRQRFNQWLMSTEPMKMPADGHARLLGDLSSPMVRRGAKLIAVFLVAMFVASPFVSLILGLSDREASVMLDLIGMPAFMGGAGCFLTYGLSSALWHAGFRPVRLSSAAESTKD
jgi:hypothetical protein